MMEQITLSKEDTELYDKFLKSVQALHREMFKECTDQQKIMSLYLTAVNMIGNIYIESSAKAKRDLMRGFVYDVRTNFKRQKQDS